MMDMIVSNVIPRFLLIKYIVKVFIKRFGEFPYYTVSMTLSGALIVYFDEEATEEVTVQKWDVAFMIGVFALILIGSIFAIGMEVSQ